MKKLLVLFLSFMAMECIAMDGENDAGVGFVKGHRSPSPVPRSNDYLFYIATTRMAQLIRESSKYKQGC